jgi:hypothetical protein
LAASSRGQRITRQTGVAERGELGMALALGGSLPAAGTATVANRSIGQRSCSTRR